MSRALVTRFNRQQSYCYSLGWEQFYVFLFFLWCSVHLSFTWPSAAAAAVVVFLPSPRVIRISGNGWHILLNFLFHTAVAFSVFAGGINQIKYPVACQVVSLPALLAFLPGPLQWHGVFVCVCACTITYFCVVWVLVWMGNMLWSVCAEICTRICIDVETRK